LRHENSLHPIDDQGSDYTDPTMLNIWLPSW